MGRVAEGDTRRPPPHVEPQLASPAGDLPEGSDWLHEVFRGGTRILAYVDGDRIRLVGANGRELKRRFSKIVAALGTLAERHEMLIDGEVASGIERGEAKLYAFDLLWLDGDDLRDKPLLTRKRRLKRLIGTSAGPIVYVDHVSGEEGRELYCEVVRRGGKGVVSKRKHAHYIAGPSPNWLEIKPETVRAGHLDALRKASGVERSTATAQWRCGAASPRLLRTASRHRRYFTGGLADAAQIGGGPRSLLRLASAARISEERVHSEKRRG